MNVKTNSRQNYIAYHSRLSLKQKANISMICLPFAWYQREEEISFIELYMHDGWPPLGVSSKNSDSIQPCDHTLYLPLTPTEQTSPQQNDSDIQMDQFSMSYLHEIPIAPFDWHLDELLYWLPRAADTVFSANREKLTCCSLVGPW